ncbi:MAG: MMPL family transporter, partial [Actinomycetia bacterium]|nr:MMPL family transporter [Actinomycetes bacterium]
MKKLLNFTLKWPAVIFAGVLIITALFFVANKKFGYMETDLDKYMPQKHPAFVYSNKAEEWFNIKDAIIIAIENKDGIYNSSVFTKIKSITRELQKMKEIKRDDVTSLYTVDNIVGVDGGIEVESIFTKVPAEQKVYDSIQKNIRNNEMIFGKLVSYDETVSVIVTELEDGVFNENFYKNILKLEEKYSGPEKIYIAGKPIIEGTMANYAKKDMRKMIPIISLLIFFLLLIIYRSFKNTILTLLVVIFSSLWVFGLMALMRIPVYAISTMMPVMLIAIGVAYGIHMYNHLKLFLLKNPDAKKKEAVLDMFNEMWKPVLMTAITTAIGFVSLITSQVYPIKYFGIFTALGVMAAMFFSLFFIPAG